MVNVNLVSILLVITAFINLTLGSSVLGGSNHQSKNLGHLFFLLTLCQSVWAAGVAAFLINGNAAIAPFIIHSYYVAAAGTFVFGLLFSLAYTGSLKWSRDVWLLVPFIGISLVIFFIPELFIEEIIINAPAAQNNVILNPTGFYVIYQLLAVAYFCAGIIALFQYAIQKPAGSIERKRAVILILAWSAISTVGGAFNLILPSLGNYQLIWVGPLGITPLAIVLYWAIIKMHLFDIKARIMSLLSYSIVLLAAAGIYILIFYLIWHYLFKIPNPSREIFVLNFVMALIVLMLFPILNELNRYLSRLLNFSDISLTHLTKNLDRLSRTRARLHHVSDLLARTLDLTGVSIVSYRPIHGGAKGDVRCEGAHSNIPANELRHLAQATLSRKQRLIWRDELQNETAAAWLGKHNIEVVLRLVDESGHMVGMLLIGAHKTRARLVDKNIAPILLVDSIISAMIEDPLSNPPVTNTRLIAV
ncbi:hypothetical protein FWH13_03590 [Candidatus Saccharibacteria bacterium]|nr:hypothetical protein [Candidatus Saccharibacteria bacterium]